MVLDHNPFGFPCTGVTGTARGALSSVNAVVGSLNGQRNYDQIGPAVNQGLLIGLVLGIPTMAIFYTSGKWLTMVHVDPLIAQEVAKYLQPISYGILPTYFSVVDQNFLFSIQRKMSPILLNSLMVGASMAVGFPLAFYQKSLAALGYGASAGAFITFVVGRLFLYFNKTDGVLDRNKYKLFIASLRSGTSFKDLLGLSLPAAMQALSEWLPTILIATLSSINTNGAQISDTLDAEQPSMQMLLILNQILLGLGTAATVAVANARGNALTKAPESEDEQLSLQNVKTIGWGNIAVTGLLTIPPAFFLAAYPDPLVRLFTSNAKAFPLAKSMLRVTGASLVLDGVRNTTTGALLGKKNRADNLFTSGTNLLITALAATALGYFTQPSLGPISFFVFRMIGIMLTTSLLLYRWKATGSDAPQRQVNANTFFARTQAALPGPATTLPSASLIERLPEDRRDNSMS